MRVPPFGGRQLSLASLIILLPALVTGILAMHTWIGGHDTIGGSPAVAAPSISLSPAGAAPSTGDHDNSPAGHHFAPTAFDVQQPAHAPDAQCSHGCETLKTSIATCVLALVLLSLALLALPAPRPLHSFRPRWRPQPVLPWTSAAATTPSLVQLSISRT